MNELGILGRIQSRLQLKAGSSIVISTAMINGLRIVSSVCLTRLLAPEVYGIAGIILSTFFMIGLISDVGFQSYLIRHPEGEDPNFLNAVWAIHAGRGVVLTIVAMLLSYPISLILQKPDLPWPLAVASLIFLVDGSASLMQFTALRRGRVQRMELFDLLTSVLQTIIGIILAFILRNIWAIVLSMIATSSVRSALSYLLFGRVRHSFRPNRKIAADLWRFSRVIAASSALTLLTSQVDKLIMGRILTLEQFGTYVIAATLAAAPVTLAYNFGSRMIYPPSAQAWRDGTSIPDAYYGTWSRLFFLYAFAGGGLITTATLVVRILYDPRYLPAGHFLSILAISTALAMLTRGMQELLVACGRIRITVEVNIVRLVWLIGAGGVALWRANAMILIWSIGLFEVPAYAYAAFSMHRERLLRPSRETMVFVTIAVGMLTGLLVTEAAHFLGR